MKVEKLEDESRKKYDENFTHWNSIASLRYVLFNGKPNKTNTTESFRKIKMIHYVVIIQLLFKNICMSVSKSRKNNPKNT